MQQPTSGETGLVEQIIRAAETVHGELGPGLPQSIYDTCLGMELEKAGLAVQRNVPVPLIYDGADLGRFYADMVVGGEVTLTIKTLDEILPYHHRQLFTYMKLGGCQTGLILNFNTVSLRDGLWLLGVLATGVTGPVPAINFSQRGHDGDTVA